MLQCSHYLFIFCTVVTMSGETSTLYVYIFEANGVQYTTNWCNSPVEAETEAKLNNLYPLAIDRSKVIAETVVHSLAERNSLLGTPYN